MPLFTLIELVYLLILVLSIGYMFTGYIKDPLSRSFRIGFSWQDFKFALLVAAPGILLHELAHKFVAIIYGLTANFYIFWAGLGIAIFLKLISSPFLLIAPGYVLISGNTEPLQSALISFAGPAVNLILWLGSALIINNARNLSRKQATFLFLTKRINMILFIFNMIPFPPLDGSKVFLGLFTHFSFLF
ncbi:MAG: M50 family metallopeptidase [Nanoarchaeota archaeon]